MARNAQDTEAKAVLRGLAKELKENPNELRDFRNGKIAKFLQKQDIALEKVDRSGSLAFDAKIFRDAAGLAHEQVKALAGNEQRTLPKLLRALKRKYVRATAYDNAAAQDPEAFDWDAFSRDIGHLFRPGVGVSCLYGPLEVQQKARKQTAARQKRVEAPLERPEELLNTTGNKQETDKLMEIMFKVLHNLNKKGEGCPVVKLVLNRQSFAQTVENIFTLSFLIRDGRASLYTDKETGMMFTRMIEPKRSHHGGGGAGPSNSSAGEQSQFITELTMADWAILCEQITETLMPHRVDEVTQPTQVRRAAAQDPAQTQAQQGARSGQKRART